MFFDVKTSSSTFSYVVFFLIIGAFSCSIYMLEIIQKQMIKKTHTNQHYHNSQLFLGIGATWVITKATNSTQVLPEIIKEVPDFSLVSHHGKLFTKDSLFNKITVLDFIFTSCFGPCPIMSNNMRTFIISTNYIQICNFYR